MPQIYKANQQCLYYVVFFFRFQEEDGIRDSSVTGVQTCALPISSRRRHTRFKCDWSSDVCSSDLFDVERETNKILGTAAKPATVTISASCQREPTIHGHIEADFTKTRAPASPEEVAKSMSEFQSTPQKMKLSSAPPHPIIVHKPAHHPRPRPHVA